jgi:hypothetical protein
MPVARLVEQASRIFGIPADVLRGRRRIGHIAVARQAVYLVALEIGWPSTLVGRRMGRDHSTVFYGRDAANAWVKHNPEYAAKVDRLRAFARKSIDAPYEGEPPSASVIPAVKRAAAAVPDREPRTSDNLDRANRRAGSDLLIAALRREFPERCAA